MLSAPHVTVIIFQSIPLLSEGTPWDLLQLEWPTMKTAWTGFTKQTHTAKIESTDGEAKTSPETAAVNIPAPTNPAWAGSWPTSTTYGKIKMPQ
jgi:hypothetical protein